jgi:polysaccharide pyruvyl transferase WcaK-like protein
MADYRSFRNEYSKGIATSLGVRGKNHVYPDIAFGLPVEAGKRPITERAAKRVVGVNPMAYYDPRSWPKNDPKVYGSYIRKLADAILWLMGKGHQVVLFSSDRMDSRAIDDVEHLVREAWVGTTSPLLERAAIDSVDALMSRLNEMDAVVATRLHSLLLSSLLKKPLLAISPQKKVEVLMHSLGQREFVINIRRFTQEEFREQFTLLESRRDAVATEIGERVSRFRDELGAQFRRVLTHPKESPNDARTA